MDKSEDTGQPDSLNINKYHDGSMRYFVSVDTFPYLPKEIDKLEFDRLFNLVEWTLSITTQHPDFTLELYQRKDRFAKS